MSSEIIRGGRWLLHGRNGWGRLLGADPAKRPAVTIENLLATRERLEIEPNAGGPLDPAAHPLSVGGLTLPPPVCVDDDGRVFLLNEDGSVLYVLRSEGRQPGTDQRFERALRLNRRPLGAPDARVHAAVGAGVLVWLKQDGQEALAIHINAAVGISNTSLAGDERFLDVAFDAAARRFVLLVVDRVTGEHSTHAWRPGDAFTTLHRPVPTATTAEPDRIWPDRILTDRKGRLWVADPARRLALSLDDDGPWAAIDTLRRHFPPPRILLDRSAMGVHRLRVPPERQAALPWPLPADWPAFDVTNGTPLAVVPDEPAGAPPFESTGSITVGPLDGERPRAAWSRVRLLLDALPTGTRLTLHAYTTETGDEPDSPEDWIHQGGMIGSEHEPESDFAVQAPTGRFIWLRIDFAGGNGSPSVTSWIVSLAEPGLMSYLPAAYQSADEESRFLERLLLAFDETWAPLEESLDHFEDELSPETATRPEMLEYLGAWLDRELDPDWSPQTRRRAVRAAADHLFRRGTPDGLAGALRTEIASTWNLAPESIAGVPFVWEHARKRSSFPLHSGVPDSGTTTHRAPALHGTDIARRLRLGTTSIGEGRFVERGSASTDHVTMDAHRFSVFVPRALVRDDENRRRIEQTLAEEQPAGSVGEVVLVEPLLRVGKQATVGVDTIIGVYPRARLAAADEHGPEAGAARLDYNCLLAEPDHITEPPGSRVGTREGSIPMRLG